MRPQRLVTRAGWSECSLSPSITPLRPHPRQQQAGKPASSGRQPVTVTQFRPVQQIVACPRNPMLSTQNAAPGSDAPGLASRRAPRSHGHTRQRRGCQTCRGRKKKCNQSYPVCGHCSRLNLVCNWEDPRPSKDSKDAADAEGPSQATGPRPDQKLQLVSLARLADPLLLLPSVDGGSEALSSSRRAMMRYYTATFALMLTTNVENNCFLSGKWWSAQY